jgi:hypothetical protein
MYVRARMYVYMYVCICVTQFPLLILIIVLLNTGGLLAAPLFSKLLDRFQVAPEYVGSAAATELVNQGGKMFTECQGKLQEVVVATAADIASCSFDGLQEGVYLVGTGSTGVAETFACLGIMYASIMTATSFVFRLPNQAAQQQIATATATATAPVAVQAIQASGEAADKLLNASKGALGGTQPMMSSGNDTANRLAALTPAMATRTPQFWNLYLGFGLAATGAYGFISSGKYICTLGHVGTCSGLSIRHGKLPFCCLLSCVQT